jgi:hypothetical protein
MLLKPIIPCSAQAASAVRSVLLSARIIARRQTHPHAANLLVVMMTERACFQQCQYEGGNQGHFSGRA